MASITNMVSVRHSSKLVSPVSRQAADKAGAIMTTAAAVRTRKARHLPHHHPNEADADKYLFLLKFSPAEPQSSLLVKFMYCLYLTNA